MRGRAMGELEPEQAITREMDYEQACLESIKRSWQHARAGRNDCVGFALADAQVYATLHLARQVQAVFPAAMQNAEAATQGEE